MARLNDKPQTLFVERTLDAWRSRATRQLTPDDAREIADNLALFVRLLAGWEREQGERDANGTATAASPSEGNAPHSAGREICHVEDRPAGQLAEQDGAEVDHARHS